MPLEGDVERGGAPGGGLPAADRFLGRFRRSWRRAELLRAAALALSAFLAAGVALVAVDLLLSLPAGARSLLRGLPFLAAAAVLVPRLRRVIPAPPARLLALRAEEEFPELEKLLSTAVEAPLPGGAVGVLFRQRLTERLARLEARARVPSRAGRLLGAASGAAVALALLVVAGGPQEVWDRWARPFSGVVSVAGWSAEAGEDVPPAAFGALLVEGVRWTVTPPAYTGLPPVEVEDAAVLSAFPGSRIEVAAEVPPPGVELAVRVIGTGASAAQEAPSPAPHGMPVPGAVERSTWRGAWTVREEHRGVSLELLRDGEVAARRVFPSSSGRTPPPTCVSSSRRRTSWWRSPVGRSPSGQRPGTTSASGASP